MKRDERNATDVPTLSSSILRAVGLLKFVQWLLLRHEEKMGQFPDFVPEFLQLMAKAYEWEADKHYERCPRHIMRKFQFHYWSQLSVHLSEAWRSSLQAYSACKTFA